MPKKCDRYSDEVRITLETILPEYKWDSNHYLFGKRSVCVDVVGKPSDKAAPLILVEAELHREDPVSNVVKIWNALQHEKSAAKMYHILCKPYRKGGPKEARGALAQFVGEKLCRDPQVDCSYEIIWSDYNPRPDSPRGGGKTLDHAREDAKRIGDSVMERKIAARSGSN